MEAKELRIGNWVIVNMTQSKVIDVMCDCVNTANHEGFPYDLVSPIPLTPEILEKAGFVTNGNKVEYVIGLPIGFGSDLFIENEDHESMSCGVKDYQGGFHYFKDIRYLHQLQNLFFAICGEELKIEL